MKYLKSYEEKHTPKFSINDVVRIKGDSNNTFFVIDGYDFRQHIMLKDVCRLKNLEDKDKLVDKEGIYFWVVEDALELVPKYELNAKKYNI